MIQQTETKEKVELPQGKNACMYDLKSILQVTKLWECFAINLISAKGFKILPFWILFHWIGNITFSLC